jgi:hypothetical protein
MQRVEDVMAATHMTVIQDCGCPMQGTFDLTDRDDVEFLGRMQRRRCLAHRRIARGDLVPLER